MYVASSLVKYPEVLVLSEAVLRRINGDSLADVYILTVQKRLCMTYRLKGLSGANDIFEYKLYAVFTTI